MLSPTVETPVQPVGAITRRPLVRLKVIVFGATGASLPTVNVPSVSVGRAESARRFVEPKLIVTATLLKPPYG